MTSKKRKRKKKKDTLVLNLLIIVALVLVIFEGQLIVTMFTHRSVMNQATATSSNSATASTDAVQSSSETSGGSTSTVKSSSIESSLAGLPGSTTSTAISASGSDTTSAAPQTLPTVSDPNSPALVPKASIAVDDSYFSDAVFIGDSRMEGFRNASGITQGQFFTSVGMSLSSMASEPIISTKEGNITVAAALSGGKYNKIYIMLGTNDLGEYDWNSFRDGFVSVTKRFRELQPDAVFYICSVIYVEESKVTTGDYINNTNVDTINSILLEICEEQGFHYLDLNEFLSNGYGSLIQDASSDGVHIYPEYCQQMLQYLKNHYVQEDNTADVPSEETESESDTASGDDA